MELIVIGFIVGLIFISCLIKKKINEKNIEKFKKSSLYNEFVSLNSYYETKFILGENRKEIQINLRWQEFQSNIYQKKLREIIRSNYSPFTQLIQIHLINLPLYNSYENNWLLIKNKINDKVIGKFIELNKLKPIVFPFLEIVLFYRTRSGDVISKKLIHKYDELLRDYQIVTKQIELETFNHHEKQKNKEYIRIERSKMSDSLRFEILKRDNYRCQVCGLSAKEGVVLHVDHIKALARGGKTEIDNLHTLCERCNLGKGVKSL